MQIPIWRNVFLLKNSLIPSFSHAKQTATVVASFHSTPLVCEKWKSKWDFDERGTQQPTKSYVRYAVRQKRAETKRALRNLLFNSGASNISFQDEDPIWKSDGTEGRDSEGSVKNRRSRFSRRRSEKFNHKRCKGRFRRESFSEDFDNPETVFEATFGNKWYTWSFSGDFTFQNSKCGFEWREKSDWTNQRTKEWETPGDWTNQRTKEWETPGDWTNQRTKEWETPSESESEDESYAAGSCSDRAILGLPPTGHLKIEDVKKAFRLSALKWHPDKHQGPAQAMAEEKFKTCVAAYKSLCHALA